MSRDSDAVLPYISMGLVATAHAGILDMCTGRTVAFIEGHQVRPHILTQYTAPFCNNHAIPNCLGPIARHRAALVQSTTTPQALL